MYWRRPFHTFAVVFRRLATAALITVVVGGLGNVPVSGDECVLTPTGVECHFAGTTTTVISHHGTGDLPPLRYLRVPGDACWYWSRWPPGIDSWNSANDTDIVMTIWLLDECRTPQAEPTRWSASRVVARAWEIFRSFPLRPPQLGLQPPDAGITGLPSYASAPTPAPLSHREVLPDGTELEVWAEVGAAHVSWGDETPVTTHEPGQLRPWPDGTVSHTFALKTCPPDYRSVHPSGHNCHPVLEAYPVAATFVWSARYRHQGGWIELGTLWRTSTVAYDVDEAVGVLR